MGDAIIVVAATIGSILVIVGLIMIPSFYEQTNPPKDVEKFKEFR